MAANCASVMRTSSPPNVAVADTTSLDRFNSTLNDNATPSAMPVSPFSS
jgi:hypothetical protein